MSRARLDRLQALAERHDPALAAWLRSGIDAWRYDGEPLERALALCGMGARRLRDAALRHAAERLVPEGSPWAQAHALARAIARAPRQGEIAEALAAAHASGCRVPTTTRRLYDVLVRHRQRDGMDTGRVDPDETLRHE